MRILTVFVVLALIVPTAAHSRVADPGQFMTRQAAEKYVTGLYRTLLNREPEPEGLAAWTEQLTSGALTRAQMIQHFKKSDEYKTKHPTGVTRPTPPATPGLPSDPGSAVTPPGGQTPIPATPGELTPEQRKQLNIRFVETIFRQILKRDPDASGFKNYVDGLNSGRFTFEQVKQGLLGSDEYKRRTASGEIPEVDPSTLIDPTRGSLDDLLAGVSTEPLGPPQGTDEGGYPHPRRFELKESDTGAIQFETFGITHQTTDNVKGGDFWFLVMEGDMAQVRIQHTSGEGRSIRTYIKPKRKAPFQGRLGCEVASDNLPDWHTWKVEWEPGTVRFYLDDRCIRTETGVNIKPKWAMVGGYVGGIGRNFKGKWRNFSSRP